MSGCPDVIQLTLSILQLNLESVTEDVNDKHLQPWSDLCKQGGVQNTPLTPYLDKELLKDNALSIDGSRVCHHSLLWLDSEVTPTAGSWSVDLMALNHRLKRIWVSTTLSHKSQKPG